MRFMQSKGFMTDFRVISVKAADAGKLLFKRNLAQQVQLYGRTADAGRDFRGLDLELCEMNAEMDLASLAAVIDTIPSHSPSPSILMPLVSTSRCNPVLVGATSMTNRNVFFPAAYGAVVRNRQVWFCQLQQALRHPHDLS